MTPWSGKLDHSSFSVFTSHCALTVSVHYFPAWCVRIEGENVFLHSLKEQREDAGPRSPRSQDWTPGFASLDAKYLTLEWWSLFLFWCPYALILSHFRSSAWILRKAKEKNVPVPTGLSFFLVESLQNYYSVRKTDHEAPVQRTKASPNGCALAAKCLVNTSLYTW